MADDDEMTIDERRKYLTRMRARYVPADRPEHGALLSEMEAVTGLHRKRLLRRLHAPSRQRQPRARQRGRTSGREVEQVVVQVVEQVVVQVWESLDFICAGRLTPTLLRTARHLARFGVLRLTEEGAAQLGQISEARVTRAAGASGWRERMTVPNCGQAAMEAAFRTALDRLPFPLVELHPDNGRECSNTPLTRLFPELVPGLQLARSRP